MSRQWLRQYLNGVVSYFVKTAYPVPTWWLRVPLYTILPLCWMLKLCVVSVVWWLRALDICSLCMMFLKSNSSKRSNFWRLRGCGVRRGSWNSAKVLGSSVNSSLILDNPSVLNKGPVLLAKYPKSSPYPGWLLYFPGLAFESDSTAAKYTKVSLWLLTHSPRFLSISLRMNVSRKQPIPHLPSP